jgi:hypothetical protein
MIAIRMEDTKMFMFSLLKSTSFDGFLMSECTITTYNTFQIDGHIHKEFYSDEDVLTSATISKWGSLKQMCFDLIKGKNPPLHFKFIFQLSKENLEKFLQLTDSSFSSTDINALVLTIKYDGSSITCMTGTALSSFSMDKTIDHLWDDFIKKFFVKHDLFFLEI